MNSSHQETSADIQETEFGSPALSKQRRIIHFSNGETLEEEDSEEEEQVSNRPPFLEPAEKARLSFKNVAILVGRISLLTCDFLGERLAGALGLTAAKYQYAIDQHHRNQKRKSSKATDNLMEEQAETIQLSPGPDGSHYGATGDTKCLADSQESCDKKHMDTSRGCQNRAYQADEVTEVYKNGEDENPILNLGSDANLFEGDIFVPQGKNAMIDKRYRWKFPIPYILGDDLDLNAKGCVHQAFEMYRLKSCVDFKPYEGEKTFIKFEKRGGCFSSVGDQQIGQILSLGTGCDHKAVIEHELLHALGFYHEQSRTDRDDYVDIWLDYVIPGLEHNFNKYNDDYITDQNTAYDYESVMHYRPFSFNKNDSTPTITTKIPEFYNIIGQYLDFSEMDTLRLNRMYNCSGPLTLLDQCAFEYASICGMIQASTDGADWVHTKSSVGAEDHTLLGKCRDAGYFMHFSTMTGKPQESALLESRTLYPKRKLQCLQFFYKMTGSSKDRLVIWVKMDDGTGTIRRMKKIHTFYADSDHTWKIAHVPMEVGVKFRYAFQAVRGDPSASAGGIFIDDISLTETRCPNSVWRIQNFSKIMETADHDTFIDSPRFYSPEGYGYGVRIWPLSTYADYTGNYTGLYFFLASGANDAVMQWPAVNRQATLVVMDQDPDIKLRMSTARSLTTDMRKTPDGKFFWDNPAKVGTHDPSCDCYKSESWGWRNFVKHFDLRRRNYLKNDDLIIFIDFEDITSLINTEVPIKPKE
ncbi:meprin A, alpha (PABA peptide hydrolase), tandem duplicate 1 isoform X2 [Epinephelus fuscoguttatus]|uniref:meprin A, alpha (PABA peptide hydrolase), tandem duplicate 1 isoform X2 n=1 Tax=Epinephelus fuscoguttatus TaxID=293821 RepID=UPI0020D06901|nr:meprin A, alpha (PABA peptide hydrolase), tandem duplicate 1 isoform X2 [Epinephelus fuscoguttatus]